MLFIYNDTSGSCSPGRASAGGLNYFLFLSAALRAAGLVTTDPQRATVFYHPACLINVYFETRLPNWKSSGAVAAQATAVQRRVLAEIATYQHRPHLLNGLRCALQSGQDGLTSHMRKTFPLLWGSRRFAHFCAEALGPVDHSRAVHLWYCQPEQQEAASSHRPLRVLFVGATFERAFGERKEHPRARAIRALRRTAGASLHTLQGRQTISDAELQALYSRAECALSRLARRVHAMTALGSPCHARAGSRSVRWATRPSQSASTTRFAPAASRCSTPSLCRRRSARGGPSPLGSSTTAPLEACCCRAPPGWPPCSAACARCATRSPATRHGTSASASTCGGRWPVSGTRPPGERRDRPRCSVGLLQQRRGEGGATRLWRDGGSTREYAPPRSSGFTRGAA